MYGKSYTASNDDSTAIRIRKISKNVQSVAQSGAFLVERIPILKYVPGYGRVLKEYREFERTIFGEQLAHVKDEMVRSRVLLLLRMECQ